MVLGNVPQYPGYPGYQLLEALIQTYISQVLIFKWMLANHGLCPDVSIITNIALSVLYEVVGCSWCFSNASSVLVGYFMATKEADFWYATLFILEAL